jgi:hypothetical protein
LFVNHAANPDIEMPPGRFGRTSVGAVLCHGAELWNPSVMETGLWRIAFLANPAVNQFTFRINACGGKVAQFACHFCPRLWRFDRQVLV